MPRSDVHKQGGTTFIEIQLACDAALDIVDVLQRVDALKATIRDDLPEAEIAVVATPVLDAATTPGP